MKILQKQFTESSGWKTVRGEATNPELYNLVLIFGDRKLISEPDIYNSALRDFPKANIILSSTAGEILDVQVSDRSVCLTAIWFEKTPVKAFSVNISKPVDSYSAGKKLAKHFEQKNLKHVMVFSDGQFVNGSDLVLGLQKGLPQEVLITGGLAGDGAAFNKTAVGLNEIPSEGKIAAVGFYGENISTSYGSVGGWRSFGPERLITRSKGNVLYELDGKPALNIYKVYLGEYAKDLPGSGLLFPLSIRSKDSEQTLVRTILAINEEENSLTFAGNMPEGTYARLMNANFDKLIEGASDAAQNSIDGITRPPDLAILISCVGRKLVLNQRVEEEVEVVRSAYGNQTAITGFYSYGEISPSFNFMKCELHNQTMTITTFTERT